MRGQIASRGALAIVAAMSAATALAQVKPASNDAQATFEKGTFLLPALSNPKDVYTIILEPTGDTARSLTLPAGSTGLRLSDAALPTGAWTWRYAIQRMDVPPILVITPVRNDVSYADLLRYSDAVSLTWKPVKGATSYRVTTRAEPLPDDKTKPPVWGSPTSVDVSAEEAVNEERDVGFYDLPLKQATRVEWTVTALDSDKQPLAKSVPMILTSGAPWSQEFSKSGWKLQRSDTLSKDNATKAALFGYASSQKEGEERSRAYQTEFALIWDGTKQGGDPFMYPRASLEARLHSSGPSKDSDALKLRFGGYRMLKSHPAELVAGVKYETESKLDTKKGFMELAYTPLFLPFGQYYPFPNPSRTNPAGNYLPDALPPLQWMVQLTVGADLGKTFSVGTSEETHKTNFRQRATLRLDTKLNGLAYSLRIPQVDLYLASTYWHLLREDKDEFTYSTTGLTFQLTKELSLEAAYSVGSDSPTFTFNRSGTVGLGLKF